MPQKTARSWGACAAGCAIGILFLAFPLLLHSHLAGRRAAQREAPRALPARARPTSVARPVPAPGAARPPARPASAAPAGGLAAEFALRYSHTDLQAIGPVMDLVAWCDHWRMERERDEVIEIARRLDPSACLPLLRALLDRRVRALPRDDVPGLWELVRWCEVRQLRDEADRLAQEVLRLSPYHAGANRRLGRVLIEGHWEDPGMAAAVAARMEACKDEVALLAPLSPRERLVWRKKKELREEFRLNGRGELIFLDSPPYLIATQPCPESAADQALSDMADVLLRVFGAFYDSYARTLELIDMKDAIVVVFLLPDQAAYDAYYFPAEPWRVAGHYEPANKRFFTYWTVRNPQGTVFHEAIHQLVDYASNTKGNQGGDDFWFQEGLAAYYGAYRRDAQQGFVFGDVSRDRYLPYMRRATRSGRAVPLADLVRRTRREVQEDSRIDDSGDRFGLYYAESWALVHFLLSGPDGKRREKFIDYFRETIRGHGDDETFRRIFGRPEDLEQEWLDYVAALE